MTEITWKIVHLKDEYFKNNSNFEEMLDPTDVDKQTKRSYVFLSIKYKNNNFLIPLRTNVESNSKFGIIGYSVPSTKRPNAGLDFRKILIVNDSKYMIDEKYCNIPKSQEKIINENYSTISKLAISYIEGYIKTAIKSRERKEKKYCFSTLHNFHKELGITESIKKKKETKIVDKPAATIFDMKNKPIEESEELKKR